MKKQIIIILILAILIICVGCTRTKYLFGPNSSIEENNTFNHYNYSAFRGEYTFSKEFDDASILRLVTYTNEDGGSLTIKICKDDIVKYEINVDETTNNTYYYELEAGNYLFNIIISTSHSGELLFTWNYQE